MDARWWNRLKARRVARRKQKRRSSVSERTRAFLNATFLAAVVLVAIGESLSNPSAIGRPHSVRNPDRIVDDEALTTSRAALHISGDAVIEYLNAVADAWPH